MPLSKQNILDMFDSLEAVMVNSFRLCEFLYNLTKEERQALLEGKADDLMALAKKKETVVAEMEKSENARSKIMGQLALGLGIESKEVTLTDLLSRLEGVDAEQVQRLQQGILALQSEIRELNNGNYALATLNLQRLEAVQGYIMGIFSTPTYYHPVVNVPTVEPPTSWGMDHLA
ncbi:MAG: flagellar protein FlgN [Anaerolineae bacterium]|nr:flagellar protein FlgN [Anaerolineae bacterium]